MALLILIASQYRSYPVCENREMRECSWVGERIETLRFGTYRNKQGANELLRIV